MNRPNAIDLTPTDRPATPAYDAPYRAFLAASLALAVSGGFALGFLLPIARLFEWDWDTRWQALVQAHGQLQLLGFGGLFIGGMSLRLMPRFSGGALAFTPLIRWIIPLVATGLVLRTIAQPSGAGVPRDVLLAISGAALGGAALALAAVTWGTLVRRNSTAEATGYFFCAGALAFVLAALLNAWIIFDMIRDDAELAVASYQLPLLIIEQFGFTLMFIAGVALRAVPVFTGRPRPDVPARVTAIVLTAGVALFAAATLYAAIETRTSSSARIADAGLLLTAAAFVSVVWYTGVFHPRANRVAAASQAPFWFVRSAFAWLFVAALLIAWYATRGLIDGELPDQFAIDAIRHVLAIGVLTMMICGMGMLIVPEFAGRRLQHPNERMLILAMALALNIATALRVWPALEGLDWLENTRYWPMAISGTLAELTIVVFAFMFAQSCWEQRRPGWGRRG